MNSLYEITTELATLERLLEAEGGDVSEGSKGEEIEKWIGAYDWAQRNKIDAYGMVVANMRSDMDAIKAEAARLNDRAKIIGNRIERMKEMIHFAMNSRGIKKIEGQRFTFTVAKNGGVQPIELRMPVELIPDDFVRLSRVPDMEKIRIALELNDPEALKIAELKERGESVRIK